MQQLVSNKRTLASTWTLLTIMLANSTRTDETEVSIITKEVLKVGGPINAIIDELIQQGYVTKNEDVINVTPFGAKMCLQSIANNPNFERIARTNTNTAFAMLFSAFHALQERLEEQPQIKAGEGSESSLVENLTKLVDFFSGKLNPAPTKTAKKK